MKAAFPVILLIVTVSQSGPVGAQQTYPRVYGSNGHLYGPTQADYQYQLQYGRPWHGLNGIRGGVGIGYVNGYPWRGGRHYYAGSGCYGAYGPYFYPPVYYGGYDVAYGAFGYAPSLPFSVDQPQLPAEHQAAMQGWLQDERRQWTSPLETMPVEQLPRRFIKPSSAAAKVQSIRLQHAGDLQFRELDFSDAASDYQDAVLTAQDRAEPYFRLGLAKAAINRFDEAVVNLKLGLQLDSQWPQTGPQLIDLFGEHNVLPKTQFKHRVLSWVQEDIRDPDRLFLLGVILHIDDDAERAAEIFEAAARLGGMKQHLHAFLLPPDRGVQAVLLDEGQQPVEAPPPAPGIDDDQQPVVPAVPTPPVGPALPPVETIIPPPLPE